MRVDQLTAADMSRLLQRLATNFGGKKDLDAKVDLYFDKLERFSLKAVEHAVDQALEGESYFPKVGTLIRLAIAWRNKHEPQAESELRKAMRAWEVDPWGEGTLADGSASAPCPVCGARLTWTARGLLVVHDDATHTAERVSYSNAGRPEWLELGPLPPPAPRKRLEPRTPNPYRDPNPPPAPAPIADVAPVVQETLERGDAYLEEENR